MSRGGARATELPSPPRLAHPRSSFGLLVRTRRTRKPNGSSESEGERLNAGIEEGDRERPVGHRTLLPDELVQLLAGDDSAPVGLHVDTRIVVWRLSVEGHAETYRLPACRSEDEVQVTGVESEADLRPRSERARALPL